MVLILSISVLLEKDTQNLKDPRDKKTPMIKLLPGLKDKRFKFENIQGGKSPFFQQFQRTHSEFILNWNATMGNSIRALTKMLKY